MTKTALVDEWLVSWFNHNPFEKSQTIVVTKQQIEDLSKRIEVILERGDHDD